MSLWAQLAELKQARFVDLTHAFEPGIPHGLGIADESRETLYAHAPEMGTLGQGFSMHRYSLAGQWGTHVDPPVHFIAGGRTLDQISVEDMLLPLCVVDMSAQVQHDPDFVLTRAHLLQWEAQHERIPESALVAFRTDWSKRWPDASAMRPAVDGRLRFPGWGLDALNFLADERNVTAIGHETTDTDPGALAGLGQFPAETLWLYKNRFQIELLTQLDQVPAVGAIAVVSFPKPKGGSGFPARVFALCPHE
jgi:kynurenine formamidase